MGRFWEEHVCRKVRANFLGRFWRQRFFPNCVGKLIEKVLGVAFLPKMRANFLGRFWGAAFLGGKSKSGGKDRQIAISGAAVARKSLVTQNAAEYTDFLCKNHHSRAHYCASLGMQVLVLTVTFCSYLLSLPEKQSAFACALKTLRSTCPRYQITNH